MKPRLGFAAAVTACVVAAAPVRGELTFERVGAYLPLDQEIVMAAPVFLYGDVAAYLRSARYAAAGTDPSQAVQRRWGSMYGMILGLRPPPEGRDDLRRLIGIDGAAVARILSFGTPPDEVRVITGSAAMAEQAAVAAALEPRGFARAQEQDWVVWHRFDDHTMQIARREPFDPFGGMLGRSARIAVRGGEVVGTSAWPTLRRVLAAIDGGPPTLDSVADFAAVLHAVAETARAEGMTTLQATGYHVRHTAMVDDMPALDRPFAEIRAEVEARARRAATGERLPVYQFVVIGDLAGAERDAGVIALSYGEQAAATTAAAILARRLGAADAPGEIAQRRAHVEPRVVALPAPVGGRMAWAAVVVASHPVDPTFRPVMSRWIDYILRREFRAISLEGQ